MRLHRAFIELARLRTENIKMVPEVPGSPPCIEELLMRSTSTAGYSTRGRDRRQRLLVLNPLPFNDGINIVSGKFLERLNVPVGPANLDRIDLGGSSQAEVESQIVLRKITASAAHFTELLHAATSDHQSRPEGCTIALCPDELEKDAVIAIRIHVLQERRSEEHTSE